MLFMIARAPDPDAIVWPGRRLFAVVDAVAWPCLWAFVVLAVPAHTGSVGSAVVAIAAFAALSRVGRALLENERYRFTTWRWGRPMVAVLFIGLLLRVATWLSGG